MNEAKETDRQIGNLFITKTGGLGIEVGGHVIVMPVKKWHDAAILLGFITDRLFKTGRPINAALRDQLKVWRS
jgi:hypothetical protein